MQQIAEHIEAGELEAAEHAALMALRIDPDDGRIRELLGIALGRTQRRVEARVQLEWASCLVPLKPESQLMLADCYLGEEQVDLGLQMLMHLSSRKDASVEHLRDAAKAADGCDHPWIAREIGIRTVRRFNDAQTWYELGYYSMRMGGPFQHAEAHARRAIDLDPENVEYRIGLSALLMKNDRLSDAYDLVRKFGRKEIDRVCCESCLRTVLSVYEAVDDERRAELCIERLASDNQPPPCD